MGGPEKVTRKHDRGSLTARERIDAVLDPGSFREMGMLNHSDMPGMEEKTPADGKVSGFGTIAGRHVAICANDFTVLASTSSRVGMQKDSELKAAAARRGLPLVYLAEAGGARMPDIMGARGMVSYGGGFDTFVHACSRVRESPMVCAVLGQCYGLPTMRRQAVHIAGGTRLIPARRVQQRSLC
jgi:methylmalonyl-CoA decarboxylase subunit alpha